MEVGRISPIPRYRPSCFCILLICFSSFRSSRLIAILDYNREDLEATWAVFRWMQEQASKLLACG
jgi:predicted RecB family nuclease